MPLKSKRQLRWMAAAEDRGEVPKGTFERWRKHTKNIKSLPEKVAAAYDMGVEEALIEFGLKQAAEAVEIPQSGRETRLKRDHNPSDFYGVKRHFERAEVRKKEVGTHVSKENDPK